MKKSTILLASVFLFTGLFSMKAQDNQQQCTIKYNLFKGDYQAKKYDDAYPNLVYLLDNCPDLSVNIYKLGGTIAEKRYEKSKSAEDAALMKRIYEQRMKYYPNDVPKYRHYIASVHSDYASFLADNELSNDDEIFSLLEKAYEADPTKMGVKNIYRYFQGVTDRNKDTNPQLVFDTYDNVLESVGKKLDDYSKKLKPLQDKEEAGEKLSRREVSLLRAYTINSKALGQVEGGLDNIIVTLSTCERLIPLYKRDFESKKDDAKWLNRAVSRMYNKECTDDPLYEKLVEALVKANPSPETSVFYAGILYKRGKVNEAMTYYQQAVDQEPDNFKKAKNLYKIAQLFAKKGQKSKARSYANQAIKNNPGYGKAYLLIASLYASSANDCGSDEFEKRMVYVAALNKARRASAVDPAISGTAAKYIKNYSSNMPDKKLIFTKGITPGSSFSIKCWIGETVKVPQE